MTEPIAEMLLNAEDSWLQRLKDPSTPLPSTDQRYDGGSHDVSTPLKNLWVSYFKNTHVLSIVNCTFLVNHQICLLYHFYLVTIHAVLQEPSGSSHL